MFFQKQPRLCSDIVDIQAVWIVQSFVFHRTAKNPYPYFKVSDATVLTSEYEGYPVVFVESLVLGTPILTTDVSDAKKEIDSKYGIVLKDNSPEEIAKDMKEIIFRLFRLELFD